MSIIDFTQIGDWIRRNQADIAIVIGFILVAIIAFGAGRLSAPEIVRNPIIIDEPSTSGSANLLDNVSQLIDATAGESSVKASPVITGQASAKGLFIASRGGTKYHWPWCSYGQKIKPENQLWFNSEKEAQAAGYSPCACIANKAPAGYKP